MHTYTHTLPSLQFWIDSLYVDVVTSVYPAQSMLPCASFVVLRHILHWRIVSGSFWITGVPLAFVPSLLPRWRFMFRQLYLFLLYVCFWMYLFMFSAMYCIAPTWVFLISVVFYFCSVVFVLSQRCTLFSALAFSYLFGTYDFH